MRGRQGDSYCRRCGVEFTPLRSDAAYCSNAHRQADYRRRRRLGPDVETALSEAKTEGNLSRANVVRKITKKPLASRRPEILKGTRHLNSNRIVEQTVRLVEQPESVMEMVDYTALDPTKLEEWISSLTESLSALRKLRNRLEKELFRARG